ncbi:26S proteasome regulatory subunit RPN8 [Cucumispora dikerogammari]|nr:26S proteasome regulatory subunit RPN8 [Cucumispora dikerogammari]
MQDAVIVHPLVLLATLDHYKRINSKRVIGILLGTKEKHTFTDPISKSQISYTETHLRNSFAIPFEEEKDLWFYDTSYFEKLLEMNYKVNNNEKLLGWYYCSDSQIKGEGMFSKERNMEISKSFLPHVSNPLTLEVHVDSDDIPCSVFEYEQGKYSRTYFRIESSESEEVGVEFLMNRFAPQTDYDTQSVTNITYALKKYESRLQVILNSINKMLETNSKNYFLIDYFQKCLNAIKRGPHSVYNEIHDLNDINTIELCKGVIEIENNNKNSK